MYNIFDIIKSLLFNKRKIDINIEDNTFTPYLINRWISMYSIELCYFINKTTNFNFKNIFGDSKEDIYNYFFNVIPKVPYKKIQFIKKNKKEINNEDKELEEMINNYAINYELSKREIREYLKLQKEFAKYE